jgi:uncharacterized protein YggE
MRHALLAALLATTITIMPACADPGLLTVAGQGTVSAVPDSVNINAGVTSTAKTAREALAANSQTMTAVFAALKKLGLPDREVRTTNLNLSQQFASAPANSMSFPFDRPVIGYRVTNNVTLTLDDPARAGAVLDTLVAAGANQSSGMSFTFRNDQGLLSEARTRAVKNAIERAHTYAAAAGITLGPIHAISDTNAIVPAYGVAAPAMAFTPPPPPIGVGEQTLRANVAVSWEIKQ